MDTEKRTQHLTERLTYIKDVFGNKQQENIRLLESKLEEFIQRENGLSTEDKFAALATLEDLFGFVERNLENELTAMDKVRIVRHSQRICLRDILENVYDNYTEIGGKDENSIDPSMLIARAYITRRSGKRVYHQPVMVIGQEKGHGEEFRNGGSVKPWGNAKALHYMKVAETENIPVHTFVFTPGSFPVEEAPGAAQQIAKNLYEMAALSVPVVAVFSEGGSGGAEAIGLADSRLMLSHGYYSVISPEGAAAIEGRLRDGKRAGPELVEKCAHQLKITADDNVRMGYIDHKIQEPALGARPYHYDFFRTLRQEVIRATDEVVLNVKGFSPFRAMALRRRKGKSIEDLDLENIHVRWSLSRKARNRLIAKRHAKFNKLSKSAFIDRRPIHRRVAAWFVEKGWDTYSYFKYDLWRSHQKKLMYAVEEVDAEARVLMDKVKGPWKKLTKAIPASSSKADKEKELTMLSQWDEEDQGKGQWSYISPRAKDDRAITCPNSDTHGCQDLWAPDLFGEYAGVCNSCGHHFPMEYQWYMHNIFDPGSIFEFNTEVESANPLGFEGFDLKLEQAKNKTGLKSSCTTFEARINNVKVVVATLIAPFRGGTVGAAEGEKFIQAAERAKKKRFPFISYVHGTAGIRIQEGVNGVIQMPRCTMAVRRYIDAGGLYLVLYDTNSYAGPLASFLGCSPYQFAIRSSNIGFAGPGVIKETTGMDIPPDYHRAQKALSRGHIQGIWDRRDARHNLSQALMTMGGRNLYYR
ncbi:carboxyl transferase domain-containing protein [Halodesulfovibrio sp. MK-HDV]|jgi:acetyl-CoA carboxylase carboxyl transferase subunit alpha/acetyl-CoA carboxylase carboxyl transferase subunit beta|uniref:carboxyl transferase domain-containing protein n=1 Tax=unclassified Halodesulfovibrio TaxID=2644657 RepID=UPI00136BB143|nr:carboxyl transferase domain-containing protein [Halodesulfovibrio sp. MK-HDV]KAF1075471.1 Acetyl-coenzyme A carboxylase carboxyl transferase subunit beta [Halodesulfovibrio sp. MK-HDV]